MNSSLSFIGLTLANLRVKFALLDIFLYIFPFSLQWGGWLLILFVANRIILACYKQSWAVNGEDRIALPEADEMEITRELDVEDQAKYSTFSASQESQQ